MTNVLDKYRKAKVLAQRGATEGERAAAEAAVERMETAHPDLKKRAEDSLIYCFSGANTSGTTNTYSAGNIVIIYFWA